jgi:hypothetical protein
MGINRRSLKQQGKDIVYESFFPECTARIDFKEIW